MPSSMADYYQARAPEFESVYDKPERQHDLRELKAWLAEQVRGRTVLEIACGTGYWTAVAADTASRIVATDLNGAPLEIARAKGLGAHVSFAQADGLALPDYGVPFDAGMAHFWWSHIVIADQQPFLRHFVSKLQRRAKLLMMDNNHVAGSTGAISRRDAAGNTYQMRNLQTGGTYEIVKNFPSTGELESALFPWCATVDVLQLQHYWALSAVLA